MVNKAFGWVLLLLGLAIIGYCFYSSYNIFTAKKPAPELFKVSEDKTVSPTGKKTGQDLQAQTEAMLQEQLKGVMGQMLPADSIPKLLNLISWSIFAAIMVLIGGKVAGIGVKMLKKD